MDKGRLKTILDQALSEGIIIQPLPSNFPFPPGISESLISAKTKQEIKDDLVKFLKEQEDLQLFDGKMLNFGTFGCRVELSQLADWLLRETKEKGAGIAIEHLDKYLLLDEVPGYDVLLICGLRVEESISLSNGIELKPLSEISWLSLQQTSPWSPLEQFPQPSAALVCSNSGGRKYRHEKFEGQPILYKSRRNDLIDACWCLTLVKPPYAPLPFAITWRAENWVPLHNQVGHAWTWLNYEQGYYVCQEIKGEEGKRRAKEIHTLFSSLSEELKDRIRIPMERLNKAIRRSHLADRCIELGIALESLFLPERNEELSFQFRLRGAWLLGKDSSERRKEIFNLLKVLYRLRSEAVHSGRVKRKQNIEGKEIDTTKILERGLFLAIEAIEVIMKQKSDPKWDDLVLDSKV